MSFDRVPSIDYYAISLKRIRLFIFISRNISVIMFKLFSGCRHKQ